MKTAIALLLALLCSFSAARDETYSYVREVPHSERSEAIFIYYQQMKPESTRNPFNGTLQEHKA